MNVASKDLCRELYELSAWQDTKFDWIEIPTWNPKFPKPADQVVYGHVCDSDHQKLVCPAYDLGYLVRKLPVDYFVGSFDTGSYEMIEVFNEWQPTATSSNTPEDTVARLLIELFKQGILQRESAS